MFLLQYYQYVSCFVYLHQSLYEREWRNDSLVNNYNPDILKDMDLTLKKYTEIKNKYELHIRNEDVFVFDIIKNVINKYLFHEKNTAPLLKKHKALYDFIDKIPLKDNLDMLDHKKLSGKRDRIKLLLIKSRMVLLWNAGSKLKRMTLDR